MYNGNARWQSRRLRCKELPSTLRISTLSFPLQDCLSRCKNLIPFKTWHLVSVMTASWVLESVTLTAGLCSGDVGFVTWRSSSYAIYYLMHDMCFILLHHFFMTSLLFIICTLPTQDIHYANMHCLAFSTKRITEAPPPPHPQNFAKNIGAEGIELETWNFACDTLVPPLVQEKYEIAPRPPPSLSFLAKTRKILYQNFRPEGVEIRARCIKWKL